MPTDRRPRTVAIVILAVLAIQAMLLLLPGHLAINGHEVDAIHAVGAAMRIAAGEVQHIDFVSPLGALTFFPAALFLKAGFGAGTAFLLAQLSVACVISPLVWYVSAYRLPPVGGAVFAALLIMMTTALVYGGDQATVSISMFYNRWAWAIYFVAVAVMLLPSSSPNTRIDGVVLGLCLSVLVLLKATYFLTLAPAVAIWVIQKRDFACGLVIGFVGIMCAVLATVIFGGVAFWAGYLADLRFVATSDVRPAPGQGLGEILAAPAFFAGTQCLLAAIIGLRRGGLPDLGLLLMLLSPGFIYITYQNWGNDPKWLILLGFLALGWRFQVKGDLFGIPARGYFSGLALACLVLSVAPVLNMIMSPIRHLASNRADYVPISSDAAHDDLLIERERSYSGEGMVNIPIADAGTDTVLQFADLEVGTCTQKFGYFGKIKEIAAALTDMGYADKLVAFADVNNPLPLIGGFTAVPQEPPWYYGGTVAADRADVLLVPKCPVSKVTFKAYIADLNEAGADWVLAEEHRHFWLFTKAE